MTSKSFWHIASYGFLKIKIFEISRLVDAGDSVVDSVRCKKANGCIW